MARRRSSLPSARRPSRQSQPSADRPRPGQIAGDLTRRLVIRQLRLQRSIRICLRSVRRRHPRDAAGGTPRDTGAMAQSDEVDRIVDAWSRERPDLDFSPLQVLSRVGRLSRHVDRARKAAFAASDLELWEFDVLSALRRAGAPYQLSPKALLQQTLVSSGTMTNRIDRLVERRLVTRDADPHDGRGILVSMTDRGTGTSGCRDPPAARRRIRAARPPAEGRPGAVERAAAEAESRLRLGDVD